MTTPFTTYRAAWVLLIAMIFPAIMWGQESTIPVLRQRQLVFDATGFVGATPDTTTLPLDVASGQHFVGNRQIAVRSGLYIHVYHTNEGGESAVYLRRSYNGRDWSARVRVSDQAFTDPCYYGSVIFVGRQDTDHVLVTYVKHSLAANRDTLYSALSSDAGRTFAPSVMISSHEDARSIIPNLTITADTAYAFWTRNTPGERWDQTWMSRSPDGGITWEPMRIAYDGHHFSFYSHATTRGRMVFLVTSDDQSFKMNIQLSRSTNAGASWVQASLVNTESGLSQPQNMNFYPHIITGLDQTLHCIWSDGREGAYHIYFARSNNNGSTWLPHVRIDDADTLSPAVNDGGASGARRGSIVQSRLGHLYALWSDDRVGPSATEANRNRDIYISQSTDGGETWGKNIRVNAATQVRGQTDPSMAIRSFGTRDTVLIMWSDARGELSSADGLHTAQSGDGAINAIVVPNPMGNNGLLRITALPLQSLVDVEVTLIDLLGRNVRTLYTAHWVSDEMLLPIRRGDITAGLYYCSIRHSKGRTLIPLVFD